MQDISAPNGRGFLGNQSCMYVYFWARGPWDRRYPCTSTVSRQNAIAAPEDVDRKKPYQATLGLNISKVHPIFKPQPISDDGGDIYLVLPPRPDALGCVNSYRRTGTALSIRPPAFPRHSHVFRLTSSTTWSEVHTFVHWRTSAKPAARVTRTMNDEKFSKHLRRTRRLH